MQFLADESCDLAVVRALRAAGDEDLAVAEISPRADDLFLIPLRLITPKNKLRIQRPYSPSAKMHGQRSVLLYTHSRIIT